MTHLAYQDTKGVWLDHVSLCGRIIRFKFKSTRKSAEVSCQNCKKSISKKDLA